MTTMIASMLVLISIQCCYGVAENSFNQIIADQNDAAAASTTYLRRKLATATMPAIYIDCGNNKDYKDALGRVWRQDTWYEGGFAYDTKSRIANVKDEYLYQTERAAQNQFDYEIPLSAGPGRYTVNLHMAEIYHVLPRQRVFDIMLDKNKPIYDIDIIARTGKPNMSLTLTRTLHVKNPPLRIEFLVGEIGFPKVNAIEVHKVADNATLTVFPPVRPKIQNKSPPKKPAVKNPPKTNKNSSAVAKKPPMTPTPPLKPATSTSNYFGGVIQKPLPPPTTTQVTKPITVIKRSATKNKEQTKHKD